MKHFWNSLQFRLYTIFGIIIFLVLVLLVRGTRIQNIALARNDQTRAASQISTNVYMLITLSHRFIDAPTAERSASLRATIESTVQSTNQILADLKIGNEERERPVLDLPEFQTLRDQIEQEWQQFTPSIDKLFASDKEAYEEAVIVVDKAATRIPDYADALTQSIDRVSTQETIDAQTVRALFTLFVALTFGVAMIIVMRSVRSITRLAETAQAFANGDFKARAEIHAVNEVAQVGVTFNQMADQIDHLVRDLEEQIILSEEARMHAEKADQVKSAFLASVSHELRTPLNAIINFSKFVVKGVMGPVTEQQTEALNKVVQSGKHLLNLINDVLDISKIESGSLSLFVEQNVDMSEILRQTYALSEALLEGKPVKMELNIDGDLPNVSADRQRLRQIMTNLLSNACKFTETGSIKVNAKLRDEKIEVTVEDTGPGIAAEDFHLVFESFKQTSTGLRQGKGTGLGMPISKNLAEAMGGKLWFESEVNKGTTFFFTLPARSEQLVKIPA